MPKLIVKLWKGHKAQIIPGVLCVLLQVWMDLTVPDYMETITLLVKTPGSSMDEILVNGVFMLLCAALSAAGAVAASFFCVRMAASFSMELRSEIFGRIESYTMEEIDTFTRASLITRSTNDVTQVQSFLSRGIQQMVRAPIMIVLALVKLSGRYWQWSALTAGAVAVVLCLLVFLIRYAHPRLRRRQALTDDISRLLRENLTGIRVIRAYNAQGYQQTRFNAANDTLTNSETQAQLAMGLMRPTVKLSNNVLMVGIYCIGAVLIAAAAPAEQLAIFSSMVVYSSYAAILIQAFMDLNMVFNIYPRADVSGRRILEVTECEPSVQDRNVRENGCDPSAEEDGTQIPGGKQNWDGPDSPARAADPSCDELREEESSEGEGGVKAARSGVRGAALFRDGIQEESSSEDIGLKAHQEPSDSGESLHDGPRKETAQRGAFLEFRHVSFHYPGSREDVLHDISFRASPGETVAIIGSTGSGKTTIANLIPRLYDVTKGEILLDGEDIRDIPQKELRSRIGYAAQSAFLFTGTVRSNVTYGRKYGEKMPRGSAAAAENGACDVRDESSMAAEREQVARRQDGAVFGNESFGTAGQDGALSGNEGSGTAGQEQADAAVRKAIRIAQAEEFVEAMPEGTLAPISRGGVNVSGGQRQRLSIARAVYRQPALYIFDDTFSALDYRTDRELRTALHRSSQGVTTLLIAQRIGTILDADRILVLDEGRIVGEGTHEELMRTCRLYREIADTQLDGSCGV